MAVLLAGLPESVPASTVNRLCGSSLDAVAIAIGHRLGASGARLIATAVSQLEATGAKRALCTLCIGVGQGIALAIERV